MPELAELKLTADFINKFAENNTFIEISKNPIHKGLSIDKPFSSFTITAESRGKELLLYLQDIKSEKQRVLLMTMGMSGHFSYTYTRDEPKHAHLRFRTDKGTSLSFVDVRRFGKWKWTSGWSGNRGPDPVKEYDAFMQNILSNIDKKEFSSPIHLFLMNQKYCNGIGNYLRAEILYRLPNLNPWESAKSAFLSEPKLFELCRDIPAKAYLLGGGQLKDWKNPFKVTDEDFLKFIRCYGNPKMSKINDKNGRMFWYDPKWDLINKV
jgi:endonuclease VIII-like 1